MKRNVFLLSMIFVLAISIGLISCPNIEHPTQEPTMFADDPFKSEHLFERKSIEEIREIVNSGGAVYQNIRIHSFTEGLKTYRVPVPHSEILGLLDIYDNRLSQYSSSSYSGSRTLTACRFNVTRIRNSGRPHRDSIVKISKENHVFSKVCLHMYSKFSVTMT